ncbi:uncharacterized protein LOC103832004 isoform X1 [Brassica rapa]|uniref:uncharacterized protein LOC103832004 isoform X1 n=1 Tax=Brassica campestris TaxID=3711 RepID=UPI00142DC036|nr:uncharacterized protein LOC103832004 isoform X1 [Brassica rapa]
MPRPCPRPYECVKRAWHIDRHQPIRGSIIRQIFRLAMEAHSAATKKNKEWQEKLPVVVLKAEEIMYSKANSESMLILYGIESMMPLTPLLEETKALKLALFCLLVLKVTFAAFFFLPLLTVSKSLHCVFILVLFWVWSAALNLGCIAVKASRSQRHSNVRTYLCLKFQQPVSASANEPQYHHHQAQKSNKPSHTAQPAIPVDVHDDRNNRGAAFLHESMQMHQKPLARKLGTITDTPAPSPAPINLGSVYPLYYGGNNQTQQVDMSSRVPIIIGMPISIKAPEERTERFCDLSLKLSVSSDPPSTRVDVGASRSYRGRNQEELCLFPEVKKKHDSFSNYQGQHSDSRVKKHKTFCGDFL